MKLKSAARKALPFAATFILGVLVASLFAGDSSAPRFGTYDRHRHCGENYRIRIERVESETIAPRAVIEDENVVVSNDPSADSAGKTVRSSRSTEKSNR